MIARIVTWAVEKRWLVLLLTVIVAAIGASLTEGPELAALAAAYVLLTDAIGPISTKFADRLVRA